MEDRLKLLFGTPVHITLGQKKNKIEIDFKTQEELDRIVDMLSKQHEDDVERKKNMLRAASSKFNV